MPLHDQPIPRATDGVLPSPPPEALRVPSRVPPRSPDRPSSPVTALTVFTFPPGERLWAFAQMGLARPLLRGADPGGFRKLMGTGRGLGFTAEPDWGRYALLSVWPDEASAREFHATSPLARRYQRHAARFSTVLLATLTSHGGWNGRNPFLPADPSAGERSGPVAVLTRATIRPARLLRFWSQVAPVSRRLREAPGLLASIGIGEAPFFRQATFSLWESIDAMKEFAYGTHEHRTAVERTRREAWYGEDLFARFAVIDIIGDFP